MKSLSANLITHLQGEKLTLANCVMIKRTDGTRLGFTDHPFDLTIDIGEGNETYTSVGGISASAHGSDVGLQDDNIDYLGVIDSVRITESDLIGGKYAGASVWSFQVNYESLADGYIKIDYGEIGEITIRDQTWQANVRSISSLLQQTIGDKYGRRCRHTLGDSNCGIELEPADWSASTAYAVGDAVKATTYDGRRYVCTTAGTSNDTEGEPTWDTTIGNTTTETDGVEWKTYDAYTKTITVTAATDDQTFADTSRTETDQWFRFGWVTWLTGNNAGLSEQVKTSGSSGAFVLVHPMPFDIQTSDTAMVTVGCNHFLKMPSDTWGTDYTGDCRAKFNLESGGNAARFGGEPDIPGSDELLRGPL